METIQGRKSLELDLNGLTERLTNYNCIMLDLGTGDGRYVHFLAGKFPDRFIIGVDACRENLCEYSRARLRNMVFIIASAQNLPQELNGLVSHMTINFPWGSLLESLLAGDPGLMQRLTAISRPAASIQLRLNSGALDESGWDLEVGAQKIYANLLHTGWQVELPTVVAPPTLRAFPSTWAKRLAFGRDPRVIAMGGFRK